MVVNFALTKNLKRYSRSGLSRRRALYKLLKNKKAVNIPTHIFVISSLPFSSHSFSLSFFFYHTYFYYYSPQRRSPLRSASPAST